MKALLFHEHGGTDVLNVEDVADPEPARGEVLVKLEACAINHLDLWVRRGWPGLDLAFPHIGGADGAGSITSIGEDVDAPELATGTRVAICPGFARGSDEFTRRGEHSLSPGFRILGEHCSGTFAEYIAVPVEVVLPMPDHAEMTVTAAAQLTFLTAWRMLLTQGDLAFLIPALFIGILLALGDHLLKRGRLAGLIDYDVLPGGGEPTSEIVRSALHIFRAQLARRILDLHNRQN